jgi:DNA-binding HxlR family transcriptional regulator
MDPDRIYRHFCMMARTLELVGERWTLLIVRDLQLGPRRFTDLARSLNDITPTRLTARLRQLEEKGIVAREPAEGGREVWYRLTKAGLGLAPVIDALTLWGIEHALEMPVPGEAVHAEAVMLGTKVWLNRNATKVPDDVVWMWLFPSEDDFTLRFTAGQWQLNRGRDEAAVVTVTTPPEAWATFLTTSRGRRRFPTRQISVEGSQAALKRFADAFAGKLSTD